MTTESSFTNSGQFHEQDETLTPSKKRKVDPTQSKNSDVKEFNIRFFLKNIKYIPEDEHNRFHSMVSDIHVRNIIRPYVNKWIDIIKRNREICELEAYGSITDEDLIPLKQCDDVTCTKSFEGGIGGNDHETCRQIRFQYQKGRFGDKALQWEPIIMVVRPSKDGNQFYTKKEAYVFAEAFIHVIAETTDTEDPSPHFYDFVFEEANTHDYISDEHIKNGFVSNIYTCWKNCVKGNEDKYRALIDDKEKLWTYTNNFELFQQRVKHLLLYKLKKMHDMIPAIVAMSKCHKEIRDIYKKSTSDG